jgi:hypothetical protein
VSGEAAARGPNWKRVDEKTPEAAARREDGSDADPVAGLAAPRARASIPALEDKDSASAIIQSVAHRKLLRDGRNRTGDQRIKGWRVQLSAPSKKLRSPVQGKGGCTCKDWVTGSWLPAELVLRSVVNNNLEALRSPSARYKHTRRDAQNAGIVNHESYP